MLDESTAAPNDGFRVEMWPVSKVRPFENNPRKNDDAVPAVAKSISEFGFNQPIVVDRDGVVVVGHTRLKAAKSLGLEVVPVYVASNRPEQQAAEYRLVDNKSSELSQWDDEKLLEELVALDEMGSDIMSFGFDEIDDDMPHRYDPEIPDVDEPPMPSLDDVETRCKPGDVWQLGDHRLVCGDSCDIGTYDRLMRGEVADLMLTDPPYNVSYVGGTEKKLTIDNDSFASEDDFRDFLSAFMNCANTVLKPGGVEYVWYAESMSKSVFDAFRASGVKPREVLVWVKNSLVLGHCDYQLKHEACVYAWKDGAAHTFTGSRKMVSVLEKAPKSMDELESMSREDALDLVREMLSLDTSILSFPKPTANREHPTMKPVALFAKLVRNSSLKGEIVLDPFAGSGTTVLACEETGRKARVIELSPKYCDVVISRWEAQTGREAVLLEEEGDGDSEAPNAEP